MTLAIRLRTAGVVHATLFGRVSRSTKRRASGVHVGVSFGKPMSNRRHSGTVKLAAEITGRGVDLVDLETAGAFELARALGGTEILCASVADRLRMATRMWRTEDDRISMGVRFVPH